MHHRQYALRLFLAQKAVVHEDARELVADGAVDKGGRDRRVDTTGQCADDVTCADAGPNAFCRFLDEGSSVPCGIAVTHAIQEVAEDLATARCVHDLRMELDAVDT